MGSVKGKGMKMTRAKRKQLLADDRFQGPVSVDEDISDFMAKYVLAVYGMKVGK